MYAISIGTENCSAQLRERLSHEIRSLRDEGLNVEVDEALRGQLTFLDFNLREDAAANSQNLTALLRHIVAGAVSDVIIDDWEERLLQKMIRSSYYYFNSDEQDTILRYAGKTLNSDNYGTPGTLRRKGQILQRVLDYLDSDCELVLEGFVTFRLKDYVEELEDAIDRAVDDFLMEKEYVEFVRLLRYFVDAQEPRIEEVHVVIKPGGSFQILDDQGQLLHNEYLEEFVVEMVDSEVNYEDLLISSLITIAPSRVTLHMPEASSRDEAVETVRSVFAERVTICRGCDTCLASHIESVESPPPGELWNWNLP